MKDFFRFLVSRTFLKQLLFLLLFVVIVLLGVIYWLRIYTHHGEKITLPSYIEQHISQAKKEADKKTFQIIVTDSVHIVGKEGGYILDQNPKPSSEVKRGRKVYVRTSKYNADTYKLSDLPQLYGNAYDQKAADLKRFEINSKIIGKEYDPGEPGHILEVQYKGKKIITKDETLNDIDIPKGATLDFIISDRAGGVIEVPDLRCKEYSAAVFYLKAGSKLSLGRIIEQGEITNRNTAYVVDQYPSAQDGREVQMGSPIDITISQERPEDCP